MTCDFIDGPAFGVPLFLSRAPIYLRVVRDTEGRWDALNMLDDAPRPEEAIFVYRSSWIGEPIHINYGDRRTGWRTPASYSVVDVLGEQFRDQHAWERWAGQQPEPAGVEGHIPEGGTWPPLRALGADAWS